MNRSPLLLLAAAALVLAPSVASAQTTVQGQIIITEVPPTQPSVPPGYVVAPAPQVMVAPQPQVVVAPQQAYACPDGSAMGSDRWGRPACMHEVTRHHVSGGLLGGGIGLFAGGYVASIFTTLFSGIFGAFATGTGGYSAQDLERYVTWGFIPLLGPWVQLGSVPPITDGGLYAWLVIEGLMQAGGLTMLIFGAIGEDYTSFEPIAGLDVHINPILTATTQGISATATF